MTTQSKVAFLSVFFLGLLLCVGGILLFVFQRDATPELTEETLREARALWKTSGPASYDLELTLGGPRAGIVRVEVRGGEVTAMQRDGVTPKRCETWAVWSVLGQFNTLEIELDHSTDPVGKVGAEEGTRWYLRCEFDPSTGYPKRFRRLVVGSEPDISWDVQSFLVVEEVVEEVGT